MSLHYYVSVFWFACALLCSLGYLLSYHFVPLCSAGCLSAALICAFLGTAKALIWGTEDFSLLWKRPIQWAHALLLEALAIGFGICLRPFALFSRSDSPSKTLKQGRPILLVHGYLHNASAWFFLQRSLRWAGLGPIYTLNLHRPFASIRDHALSVARQADLIAQKTQRNDLVVIGHSMGGLVGAWYALNIAPEEKKIDVVTIGSPLQGTRMAALAPGLNGQEMRFGSDFVQNLFEEMRSSKKIRFYHIASSADQIVVPWTSALSGCNREREFLVEDLGHMTLLFSPRIAEKIHSWIASE